MSPVGGFLSDALADAQTQCCKPRESHPPMSQLHARAGGSCKANAQMMITNVTVMLVLAMVIMKVRTIIITIVVVVTTINILITVLT